MHVPGIYCLKMFHVLFVLSGFSHVLWTWGGSCKCWGHLRALCGGSYRCWGHPRALWGGSHRYWGRPRALPFLVGTFVSSLWYLFTKCPAQFSCVSLRGIYLLTHGISYKQNESGQGSQQSCGHSTQHHKVGHFALKEGLMAGHPDAVLPPQGTRSPL